MQQAEICMKIIIFLYEYMINLLKMRYKVKKLFKGLCAVLVGGLPQI